MANKKEWQKRKRKGRPGIKSINNIMMKYCEKTNKLNNSRRKLNEQTNKARKGKKESGKKGKQNGHKPYTRKSGLLTSVVTARVNGHLMVIDNHLFPSHDITAGLMNFHFGSSCLYLMNQKLEATKVDLIRYIFRREK